MSEQPDEQAETSPVPPPVPPPPDEGDEAAEAEADEGASGPDAEGASTPAQVPAAPDQPADAPPALGVTDSAQVEELEKAQNTYLRKVEKTLGPAMMPPLCPTCEGTGLDFTGGQGEPDYLPSPDREQCPDCAGLGKVRSGSRVPGEDVLPCPGCQGAGHRIVLPAGAQPQLVPAPVYVTPGPQSATHGAASWQGDPSIGGAAG